MHKLITAEMFHRDLHILKLEKIVYSSHVVGRWLEGNKLEQARGALEQQDIV